MTKNEVFTSRCLLAVATVAALMLAGCGILPRVSEPVDLYTLTPKTSFGDTLPQVDWQLVVDKPSAPAGIESARLALSRSPYTLEYFARASWIDSAPAMVQRLLIESFESSGKIVGVGREAIGLRSDYILVSDLREFEAVYDAGDGPPEALVRLNVKLVQMPERRIVASQTVESRSRASSTAIADIVVAFDEALGKVLKDIVVFTLTTRQH